MKTWLRPSVFFIKWPYYAIVAFVNWNNIPCCWNSRNTLFWENWNSSWVNIELEGLIPEVPESLYLLLVVIYIRCLFPYCWFGCQNIRKTQILLRDSTSRGKKSKGISWNLKIVLQFSPMVLWFQYYQSQMWTWFWFSLKLWSILCEFSCYINFFFFSLLGLGNTKKKKKKLVIFKVMIGSAVLQGSSAQGRKHLVSLVFSCK